MSLGYNMRPLCYATNVTAEGPRLRPRGSERIRSGARCCGRRLLLSAGRRPPFSVPCVGTLAFRRTRVCGRPSSLKRDASDGAVDDDDP
mmetsp:Transcript_7461/g.30878  ORF Transcript_7461/g.30878 Transcript_7461/m.30878 type:complete len:89 (+) Transcript_7461:293-559(+)